ncbi:sensor histidine kinase [Frigoribacterium sp. 2-23]|uniref:sensor histidine kinase n=1 Tax=Frigoribacterium sp. 2-23 TaxID=3415006 RepID=UPI003C6F59F2
MQQRAGTDGVRPPGSGFRLPAPLMDVLPTLVVLALAFAPFPERQFRADDAVSLTVALLPIPALLVRRRWPLPVLVVCVALFGVGALGDVLAPGIVFAVAVSMFGVAHRTTRRITVIAAAGAIVAVAGLSLLASLGTVFDPRSVQFAVTIAFAAAAGDATRSRRAYLEATVERAERAERTREAEARRRVSEERLRIARDLHDAVAHQIAVISLNAGVASSALETRPDKAKEALVTIRGASRTVLGEIGDLLDMLRRDDDPDGPAAAGAESPQAGLARLDDLVAQFEAGGLAVTVRVDGDLAVVPGAPDAVAYRVVQEGLTNAQKHGARDRAHIHLDATPRALVVAVTNPIDPTTDRLAGDDVPVGARPAAVPREARHGGYGLLGLRERVASVRGTLDAGPTPGGWRLAATLPVTEETPTP